MDGRDTVDVLGLRFDRLTRAQAAEAVVRLATSGDKHYVVKPYSEFMPRARSDARIREMLNGASLCLADGVGVLWAAHYLSLRGGTLRALGQLPLSLGALTLNPRALRRPLTEAMHGVDFTWEMLTAIERAGLSVYLLGGPANEVRGATASIAERLPGLRIAGAHPGHLARGENATVVRQIDEATPDVLLVAMGFPKQERWITENLPALAVKIAVAEGGSFSFMSGAVSRAPVWMRRAGIEWLYRLLRQPWRLRRQLALPVFVWLVVRERLGGAS
ncbi:MAG: WecB/TagA/CpsF family glycosyltransferase [Chloroflexota bacterium]|nr:WecB/TagA/CpsF family glycosyltransferase [Chloroflexota bacterium]